MKADIHRLFLAGPKVYTFDAPRRAYFVRREAYIERARLNRSEPLSHVTRAANKLTLRLVGCDLHVEYKQPSQVARDLAAAMQGATNQ